MNTTQRQAIEAHGRNLLKLFPNAVERDPIALCKKLRRLERKAAAVALRLCNGPEYPSYEYVDKLTDTILRKVDCLLGNHSPPKVPTFINRDPRGYALKIDDAWMREHRGVALHEDWGGYGILAPEIRGDE